MKAVEVMWNDLTQEAQKRIQKDLNLVDNCNFDDIPIPFWKSEPIPTVENRSLTEIESSVNKTVWAVIFHNGDSHELYLFQSYNNAIAAFRRLRQDVQDNFTDDDEVLADTDTDYWVDTIDNFGYTTHHIRLSIAEYLVN